MVQVIKSKILWKWSEGRLKLLLVGGRFELLRVWVTKGKISVMYEGNPGEINLMVQVSASFELANLRFRLSRVYCKMKKIRRSSISGLHFQGSSFSGTRFWVFTTNFSWVFVFGSVFQVLGLRFWGSLFLQWP